MGTTILVVVIVVLVAVLAFGGGGPPVSPLVPRGRGGDAVGVPVPGPVGGRENGTGPEHEAMLADSVGLALLVVLGTLAPAERLAFVLHDMFALPFEEIGPIVGRSSTAARQLAPPKGEEIMDACARAPVTDGAAVWPVPGSEYTLLT